ncbi:MAG: hypothetical protein KKD44_27985 [Proteobacteria bacterium]|nr:hypothetical protein [Pseudomonadota bacterium]
MAESSKICPKCSKAKSRVDFSKNKSKKDGLSDWCKVCSSEYSGEYRDKNKDSLATKSKEYREKNKEILAKKDKERNKRDAKKIAARKKIYNEKNREIIAVKRREAYLKRKSMRIKRMPIRFPGIKFCTNCKEEKTPEDFHNDKNTKDGKCSICAECNKKRSNAYHLKNRVIRPQPIRFADIKFCPKCKEEKSEGKFGTTKKGKLRSWCNSCLAEDARIRRANDIRPKKEYLPRMEGSKECSKCAINKEITLFHVNKSATDGRCSQCIECVKEYGSEYSEKNREKIRRRSAEWYENNLDYVLVRQREKYHNDPEFKLSITLRHITSRVANGQKAGSFVEDLGCSISECRMYLEFQFYANSETGEEMIWDNQGKGKGSWQIHHIKPLAFFDLTIREQFLEAAHYTNLKPLWHKDHVKEHYRLRSLAIIRKTAYNQDQSYIFY